jgi:hypothetical protein
MSWSISSRATIRRFFNAGFTAADVAEALVSYDSSRLSDEVAARMDARAFQVVGIRDDGQVVGYVNREGLSGGTCADHILYFGSNQLVDAQTPLRETVIALDAQPCVFVKILGTVGGIVRRTDLQKPPVRMWLFGLITLIEHAYGDLIETNFPDDAWREHLSPGRLQAAEEFQAERKRCHEDLTLLSCLQFGDKARIVFKDETIRKQIGFKSRNKATESAKNMEQLRNALAHTQDIVSRNWQTMVEMCRNVDRVLELGEMPGKLATDDR